MPGAEHLRGATLVCEDYRTRQGATEHDLCEVCRGRFMERSEARLLDRSQYLAARTYGYTTTDEHEHGAGAHWVCAPCFDALHVSYGWRAPPPGRRERVDEVVDWVGEKVLRWVFWHVPPH